MPPIRPVNPILKAFHIEDSTESPLSEMSEEFQISKNRKSINNVDLESKWIKEYNITQLVNTSNFVFIWFVNRRNIMKNIRNLYIFYLIAKLYLKFPCSNFKNLI